MLTRGLQTLSLTGLRFDANLGILEHEKTDPQPIQVDAERVSDCDGELVVVAWGGSVGRWSQRGC